MNIEILTKNDLLDLRRDIVADLTKLIVNRREPDTWLRSREVQELLKISAGTLQNLRIAGKLSCRKVGGTLYFKRDDIDVMMNAS